MDSLELYPSSEFMNSRFLDMNMINIFISERSYAKKRNLPRKYHFVHQWRISPSLTITTKLNNNKSIKIFQQVNSKFILLFVSPSTGLERFFFFFALLRIVLQIKNVFFASSSHWIPQQKIENSKSAANDKICGAKNYWEFERISVLIFTENSSKILIMPH